MELVFSASGASSRKPSRHHNIIGFRLRLFGLVHTRPTWTSSVVQRPKSLTAGISAVCSTSSDHCCGSSASMSDILRIFYPSFSKSKNHEKIIITQCVMSQRLDLWWVEHNADAMAHGLWWQVGGELCTDNARVTMGARSMILVVIRSRYTPMEKVRVTMGARNVI